MNPPETGLSGNTASHPLEDRLRSHNNDQEKAKDPDLIPGLSSSDSRGSSEEGEVEDADESTVQLDLAHKKLSEESEESSAPPLPSEPPPGTTQGVDDGWAPIWEEKAQGFYFYNRFTGASQWTNPRVPDSSTLTSTLGPPGVDSPSRPSIIDPPPTIIKPGYNPAIHGDYDPNAWYAQPAQAELSLEFTSENPDSTTHYTTTAAFNRFTGRFQNPEITPDNFNDESKCRRQMNAYFDVDAAANSHDGRSLKAERSGKKLSKTELKQFKEKRKMKKEERRRAWLRD